MARTTRLLALAAPLALLVLSASAMAQTEEGEQRPGLWRYTFVVQGKPAPGVINWCWDGPARLSAIATSSPLGAQRSGGCESVIRAIPNGRSIESKCVRDGRAQGMHVDLSQTPSGHVTMASELLTGGEGDGARGPELVMDGDLVGACPADMQPGEARPEAGADMKVIASAMGALAGLGGPRR
jgi:hypothetical protein